MKDRRLKMKDLFLFLFCFLVFPTGCFPPPKMVFPENTKRVSVLSFQNESIEYGLSERLREGIVDEIVKDGRLTIENKEPDCKIKGRIYLYKKEPIAWTKEYKIIEYRLMLITDVFVENRDGNKIWEGKLIEEITYTPTTSPIDTDKETEMQAKKRLIKKMSRKIINRLLYGL